MGEIEKCPDCGDTITKIRPCRECGYYDDNSLDELRARIKELEETIEFARNYSGFEARACPLCTYENGKFIKRCRMHEDMDKKTI